jgi:hypothetical protein
MTDNQTAAFDLTGTFRDIAINEAAFALLQADGRSLTNQARAAITAYETTMSQLMPGGRPAGGVATEG